MDFRFVKEYLKPGDSVFYNEDIQLTPQIYVGFDEEGALVTKEFGEWEFYSWDTQNEIREWKYYSIKEAKKNVVQKLLD